MQNSMKKILFILSAVLLFTGCTGNKAVDKVDEKGHNPAPEQIIDPNVRVATDTMTVATDTLAQ